MTVKQLLANTDSKELSEWPIFFEMDHEREKKSRDKNTELGTKIQNAYHTQKARKI
jgi:hypothetical protein